MPLLGRRSNQATFFSEAVKERLPKNHFLKVNNLIDWSPIEKKLECLYDPSNGRPSYPPLMMFKALLLQQWFNLSDRGLVEAIADRLSFQSFLGLSIVDPVPDDTTFTRFRQKLQEKGLLEELFSILDSEFDRLGLLVKRGSFIDATIVQAQRRPSSKEKADTEEEQDPCAIQIQSSTKEEDPSSHDESAKTKEKDNATKLTKNGKAYYATDLDARWTVKRGKPYYGYKMHINSDESGIVRGMEVTPANVHDSRKLKNLISKEEEAIYADKAYDSEGVRSWCEENNIECCILHKGKRNKPLTETELEENKIWSKRRFRVEQIFGIAKRCYNLDRFPYVGLLPNKIKAFMTVMAMNIKRAFNIIQTHKNAISSCGSA